MIHFKNVYCNGRVFEIPSLQSYAVLKIKLHADSLLQFDRPRVTGGEVLCSEDSQHSSAVKPCSRAAIRKQNIVARKHGHIVEGGAGASWEALKKGDFFEPLINYYRIVHSVSDRRLIFSVFKRQRRGEMLPRVLHQRSL